VARVETAAENYLPGGATGAGRINHHRHAVAMRHDWTQFLHSIHKAVTGDPTRGKFGQVLWRAEQNSDRMPVDLDWNRLLFGQVSEIRMNIECSKSFGIGQPTVEAPPLAAVTTGISVTRFERKRAIKRAL
jgi:hypothetical protein